MAENDINGAQIGEKLAESAKYLAESKGSGFSWESVKKGLVNFVGALFMEKNKGQWSVSTGKVSWWLAFIPALYIWLDPVSREAGKDITPNHINILMILAGYNFSKKIMDTIQVIKGKSPDNDRG